MPAVPIEVSRADIARLFGVRRQAVSNWIVRRPRNHFPLPIGHATAPLRRGSRTVDTWDLAEIEAWRASYIPATGRPASGGLLSAVGDEHRPGPRISGGGGRLP